jgi:hypothetical protein
MSRKINGLEPGDYVEIQNLALKGMVLEYCFWNASDRKHVVVLNGFSCVLPRNAIVKKVPKPR